MKRKIVIALLCGILAISSVTACGSAEETAAKAATTTGTTQESDEDAKAAEEAAAKEAEEKAAEEAAAKEAEAEEAYETGRACLYGLDGQEIDLETAYNSFEKALELGKTEANFYLGVMYDWESYPEQDYEKARVYYEAAGENPYAYVALGYNYCYGRGVEADQEKGKEYFDNAIALGCMDGYYGLGQIAFDEGDYTTAMEDYEMAAEKGTEPLYMGNAMNVIGFMNQYLDGDNEKALEWYEKGAEQGNAVCMVNAGMMYRDGIGVEQDVEKALEWFEEGALAGESKGYLGIGMVYCDGTGTEQDVEKALEWFEKGAEQGNAEFMKMIAKVYHDGTGVEQDGEKAIEWLEKAYEVADENNDIYSKYAYAFDIASWYTDGSVEENAEKAAEWSSKAEEALQKIS